MQLKDSRKQIRILHLEDNPSDAELCLAKLRLAGLDVKSDLVSSPEVFKDRATANHYDLIVGDYRLPAWTGLEAVRWLRTQGISTPFILVTGTLGDELAAECIREGANDYVLKDKMDRLPFAIERCLEEQKLRSAREQAEHELRRSEQQFAAIVRNAPYGICRTNLVGEVLMANPALVSMLGYQTESELLGLDMAEDIYWSQADCQKAAISQSAGLHLTGSGSSKENFHQSELQWRRKDGKPIFVRLAAREVQSDSGEPEYEGFVQDITEQRTLEREFQQAQKMEAIGRLAGGVAHDFNNLLMIIRGCAELLDYHKTQPDKVNAYLKQINDATSIAASVVQQLLMFSRKQTPEPIVLDLNSVLKFLGKMLPRLLGEDVAIEFKHGAGLHNVSADRSQVEQIILNLAVNARDAMPNGGRLEIETFNQHLDAQDAARFGVDSLSGDYAVLSLRDNGLGMDEEVQSHIFEPFFTTKERGKGTGLGLATVYGIVRQSGGFISVNSQLGEGTVFKVFFPRASASKELPDAVPIAPPAPGGTETILLVEDEAALREITMEYLQSKGYVVLSASNGMQALEICRMHPDPINVVLTDIVMPGIPGPAFVEAALQMRPGMPVIYVSGYSDRGWGEDQLGPRASFLRKPYGLAELGRRIRTALASPDSAAVNS